MGSQYKWFIDWIFYWKYYRLMIAIVIYIALSAIAENHSVYGSKTQRIALLPFNINAAGDVSFLKDGIYDMFMTRLSSEGRVEVISRTKIEEALKAEAVSGPLNENTACRIGTRLNADFVLYGSLTVLGEKVSIDAKMVDSSGNQPTMAFFDQSQDLGAVITKINRMAADINDKMFGRRTQTATKVPPVAQPQPQPARKKADIYAHPETVLEDDGFIEHGRQTPADASGIILPDAHESQAQFWKSANFKYLINGVAIGDVDGDGKNETVTITPHSVVIFRSEGGSFRKIAKIKESASKNLTGVDVADINDNGYAEILVTSFNANRAMLNS